MHESLYFLIEGGKALELVKRHIQEVKAAETRAIKLCKEIGAKYWTGDKLTGRLTGVVFAPGQTPHPDFLKPGRFGICYPRKKSEWFNRIQAVKGHPITSELISQELGVPVTLHWKNAFMHLGHPFKQAGFVYPSEDGPYGMYIPDVQSAIKAARRGLPNEPERSFKPEFEGCKRILRQDWELIVAQHDVAEARRIEDFKLAKEAQKAAKVSSVKTASTTTTGKKKALASA